MARRCCSYTLPRAVGTVFVGGAPAYVSLHVLCLALLLQLAQGQGVWSDLVNSAGGDFDYQCPASTVVVGLASVYRMSHFDRQWEYQCGSGGDNLANVSTSCTLQPTVNAAGDDIEFTCPGNGYLGGFQSAFDSASFDRLWTPYCCQRPFAALIDCIQPTSGWENDFRTTLNFSAPDGHIIAGVTSYFFNRDRRWRFRTCAIEVNCTDPGTPDNSQREGNSFLYRESVTYTCNHGYYQSEGPEGGVRTCQQNGLWSGVEPVCTACTGIDNCADVRCTNATDHVCVECASYHGDTLGMAGYENLGTECQPLCSWLQGFCYPGTCSDGLSSCNCSSGFAGPDCLNILVPPELLSCSNTIRHMTQELHVDCSNSSSLDSPVYTNILPLEVEADWSADFLGPSLPIMPFYVVGVGVGVASSNVHTYLYRAANPLEPVSMVTLPCRDPAPSPDTPVSGISECTSLADSTHLSNHTFLHGDMFILETTVLNGGYLDIHDLDTSSTSRYYYSGTPIVGAAKFILDVNPPVHCSLTSIPSCIVGQNLLQAGNGITESTEIDINWGGWVDDPAGVYSYTVDVYRLSEVNGTLLETLPLSSAVFNESGMTVYQYPVNMSEGAFSVVLQVMDVAGNTRYSRRLLLIDVTSQLLIDNTTTLRVASAVPETGFLWLNSTTTPIIVSGRGHFYNTHLRTQNLLAPTANFSPPISTEYDHPLETGSYPRGGTPNALGVTVLNYHIAIDQEGGMAEDSLREPAVFGRATDDLELEGALIETGELQDGDSVRVWFQAEDYLSQVVVDSVLFHVDSSAPELDNLWLEWNGINQLALHGTKSLLDLTIKFETRDPHSGVSSLKYWIGTETDIIDVAWGQIPVQSNCSSSSLCVCDSLNHCSLTQYSLSPITPHFITSHSTLHDTEYYITVMATNHALLTSSLTHTFTTDTTPPITGYVMDAEFGSHDVDYTHHTTVTAWWGDFFDRETSILIFQYHFGTECANSSAFSYPLMEGVVMETSGTQAMWQAPGPGTYYVTVVAYNHALQPSLPACSDGITIDLSAPVINEVIIVGVVETEDIMYITTDHHINVTWEATDDVGIRDYHIAAVSEEAFLQGQSVNFTFAGRTSYFSLLDSDLLSQGNTFYVVVKATDLALHEDEMVLGPVRVDISAPVISGNLTVERGRDHVIVTWQNDSFTDDQSGVTAIEFSIGKSEYGAQVAEFSPLPSLPSPLCPTPHCLTIFTSSLPLLTDHTYYITLRIQNAAGLESFITSGGHTHIYGPPSGGRVIDLDPHALSSEDACIGLHDSDTDLILDSDWLASRWEGFDHAHLNVTFSVSLGSIPGNDDVVPFQSIGTQSHHNFTNLTLRHGERYYITVIAGNEFGTTDATSDGFLYLSDMEQAVSMATVADGNEEGVDRDYQYSVSSLSAQWVFPPALLPYLSHYMWAVYLQDPVSLELMVVRTYENVGAHTSSTASGMELRQGEVYVIGVQACLSTPIPTCLSPVYSDGVHILSPPRPSSLYAVYTPLTWNVDLSTSTYGRLVVEWSPFLDTKIVYYEWAIGTGEPGYELLTEWNQVEWYETRVTAYLNATISLHKTHTVALQGYNAAGLYSRTGVGLHWNVDGEALPQHHVPRSKLVVYDIPETLVPELATTDWRELEYSDWDPVAMELDYTNSATSLSAAWPDLRYMMYTYSVSTTPTFTTCGSSTNVACGTTIANSVTIPDLTLQHGQRYYVCVEGQREDAIHPTPSTPNTLTACTNGITADLTPPIGSCVAISNPVLDQDETEDVASGSGFSGLIPFHEECNYNGSEFQASSSDIRIVWSPFQDVEWYGNAVHVSGVAYYEYAIGTQPGESDVVPFTGVGVVNDVIVTGLRLQSGVVYYATIRAHDFTGQWSDVTSSGVTVDLTPPYGPSHFHLVNPDSTYTSLPLVVDTDSGVSGIEIGLGSRPGSSDLLEWTAASYGAGLEGFINLAGISDGQLVFASIQARNGAGLTAIYSSLGHTHDSTPPHPGIVYDTLPHVSHDLSGDADHTSSLSELSARWTDWSDPHTATVDYYWAIGSCQSCNDVQDFLSVGVATVGVRSGLLLSPSVTYYVTVRGCNVIGLCSEAMSNGITVDVTPPITGWIKDGWSGMDQQYQSSRSYIAAHWSGFHDAESSLQSYTLSAGLWPDDDSLLPPTSLPPSTSSLLHPVTLPANITIYINLVAISNAGLMTSVTSDGVFIDDSPPIVRNITVDTEWAGSAAPETQYSNTGLRVAWNSHNLLSPIHSNSWFILSYSNTAIPLDTQNVGNGNSGTASGLLLADGDTYSIVVTTCNGAGLCTVAESSSILVDSTPPLDGYFAVETGSTFPRNTTVPGGMTWRNRLRAGDSRINLAFYGFSDIHSGISEYWATVGTSYGESNLTGGPLLLASSPASESGTRTASVAMERHLDINETVYISLWAVNGAGLESRRVQGSFVVQEVEDRPTNGTLHLRRSSLCDLHSCLGHCTCAARGDLCPVNSDEIPMCVGIEPTAVSGELSVRVVNVASQQATGGGDLFTAITDKLLGRWEVPDPSPYQRLEWTVGENGASPGSGLFDTTYQHVWQEAGDSLSAIFSVNPLYPLLNGRSYVFHVRAWYNFTHYTVFQSTGITVDVSGPQVVAGGRLREGGSGDIDYSANQTNIGVSWGGVFIQELSGVHSSYEIGIGDTPGMDNVVSFSPVPSAQTTATLTGSFSHGRRYYSSLRATSPLAVTVDSISDGFIVDLSPPQVGVVLDGLSYHDDISQSNTDSLSARWTGFHDPESGIHHYEVAWSDSPDPPAEGQYVNVGIRLHWTVTVLSLSHGITYYIHIVAVNNAGVRSLSVASNGITVDTTRPEHLYCEWVPLNISTFDPIITGSSPCNYTNVGVDQVPPSQDFTPLSGCVSQLLQSPLSLPLQTTAGSIYTVSFWVRPRPHPEGCGHQTPLLARVMAPGLEEVVSVHTQRGDTLYRWSHFQFQFTADDPTSILTLSSENGLVLDGVSVEECQSVESTSFDDIITNRTSVFRVSQEHISGMRTRLQVAWDVGDREGGVSEYLWAIGTTERGEQLQPFTSTGSAPFGISRELFTFHTQRLYISVLVWNHAGLETLVSGGPYVVDFTAPELTEGGGVWDGDYQNNTVLQADWSDIIDPESGIEECAFMIGTSAGLGDLHPHTPTTLTSSQVTLSHIFHGTTAITTVTCRNSAGLQATFSSNGVTILLTPPTNYSAYLAILSPVLTVYQSRDSHVASENVTLRWGGFIEAAGTPLLYEVCLGEGGGGEGGDGSCVMVGSERQLVIDGVGMASYEEEVSVTAVNLAGLHSPPVRGRVVFQTQPPLDTGSAINVTLTGGSLSVDWSGKFRSVPPAPLSYELSAGTLTGSGIIQKWEEISTDHTYYTIVDSRLSEERDYFLTVVAIARSGLHTTASHMWAGLPLPPPQP